MDVFSSMFHSTSKPNKDADYLGDKSKKNVLPLRSSNAQYTGSTVTAVLLGETGAGKSSLINLFHFWSLETNGMQPRFEDAKKTSIIQADNENGGSQSGSQTLKPRVYQFNLRFENQDYLFSLLDTPGMGDVKGLKQDDDNILTILKFVENTPSVNGVIFVLNGSNCRVSSRTQYILQRLYGMCPKTFEKNFYLIFTNTQLKPNFDLNCIKVPILKDNVFPMDNLLYSPGGLEFAESRRIEQRKIQRNYTENKDILTMMFEQLIKGGALRPDAFKDLRVNRDILRVKVSWIPRAIQDANDVKADLERQVAELQNNIKPTLYGLKKKAAMTTERVQIMQKRTPYHNTQCLRCAAICHENCQLDRTTEVGHNIFRGCACMTNDVCNDCNHGYQEHVLVDFIFEHKIIQESLLTNSERVKLSEMTYVESQKQMIIQRLSECVKDIEQNVLMLKNDLSAALCQLKQLCPYYDYKLELNCAIKLLEEEEELTGLKAHDPKELQSLKIYFTDLIEKFDQAFK